MALDSSLSSETPSRRRTVCGGTILRGISRICGTLELDCIETTANEIINIHWSVSDDSPSLPNERDWIGLFFIDDLDPESYIDYRMRGQNLDNEGNIQWALPHINGQVCFCFYTVNNILLAQSDTLTIKQDTPAVDTSIVESNDQQPLIVINEPIPIKVYDITCDGLRVKTFGIPDPFVKLTLTKHKGQQSMKQQHHGQTVTTTVANHTCNHQWINETFEFIALPTDVIEVEVRDKFALSRPSASHFMGKALIPLNFLQYQRSFTRCYQLQKRLPSDRVTGSISITISSDLDLPNDTSVNTLLSPIQELTDNEEHDELPEQSSDRIRYVRRTLHGDRYRQRSNTAASNRFLSRSVIVRNTDTSPNHETISQQNLHVGLEQFMARSCRNDLMRQHSCPLNRRVSPLELNIPEPPATTESTTVSATSSIPVTPGVTGSIPVTPTIDVLATSSIPTEPTIPVTPTTSSIPVTPTTSSIPVTPTTSSIPVTPTIDVSASSPLESPQMIFVTEADIIDRSVSEEVQTSSSTTTLSVHPTFQRVDSVDDSVKDHPGFLFLTRNDFYKFIKDSGNTVFLKDISLLKLVQSIRSDHSLYIRYHHSSKLVKAINSFAQVNCELPDGWEKKVDRTTQKVVFIDHNSQTTTFIDPRLPLPGRELKSLSDQSQGIMRTRPVYSATYQQSLSSLEATPTNNSRGRFESAPPRTNPIGSDNSLQDYSSKIVAFLRQDNIFSLLSSRYEQDISHELRISIEEIREEGVPRLERLQNESDEIYFELTIMLSLFETDIDHQLFNNELPTEVTPPSTDTPTNITHPPPVTTAPDMDLNSTDYMGIPLEDIIEFFQAQNVYHIVLARYGSIQPHMRTFINQFSNSLSFEVAEELNNNLQAREFIFGLYDDILQLNNTSNQTVVNDQPSTNVIPTARQVRDFISQNDILTRMGITDPDERSIVQVCGTWDLPLIEFELNRRSVLRDLVLRLSDQIIQHSDNVHVDQQEQVETTPVHKPLPLNEAFIHKLKQLQSLLDVNGYASTMYGEQKISIRREYLLKDAYRCIMGVPSKSLRIKRCNIMWDEEEGLDYGGPQREFFFKLSRLLFNPYYGLFEYTSHGSYTVQLSQYSSNIDDAHLWFRFAGRVIGYAIIQNNLLDVFFARHIYKSLLNIPYTVSDVESIDLSFYNSLKYVLENDPAPLELTFTVPEESFGQIIDKELKPGGAQIEVKEDNKKEYVELMVQWRLSHGVQYQMENLLKGLKEMIPLEYLKPFDAQELEWVIAGTPEINMSDWKENTQYWGGYHPTHSVILWFWEAIESFPDEMKLRFLQFTTGTSSIPYEGFKALKGSSQQIQKFTIDRFTGPVDSLIIAHTCFNRIDLPPYRSLEEMKQKLLYAICETDTFETA